MRRVFLALGVALLSRQAAADPAADRAAAVVAQTQGGDPLKVPQPNFRADKSFQERGMAFCEKHGKKCYIEPGVGVIMERTK